jgi:NADPH-dependent 2,4-dienoyl-CoA reductase/sulfur reductase-like enzyme
MRRVVVAGGSLAGVNAVEALREHDYAGEIVLVSAEQGLPYDRPPLSKDALRTGVAGDDLLLKPRGWYDDQDVQLHLGVAAAGIDARAKEVALVDGRTLPFDGAVIATGSYVRALPGLDTAGTVRTLRTATDSEALRSELLPGRHLVVVGAGFIGLEVAATARDLGLAVTVVEIAAIPLARVLGIEGGGWFQELHATHGVDVRCGTTVVRIEPSGGGSRLELSDGSLLDADLVLAGVGVSPSTDWLAGSGLVIRDGVVCDSSLRTGLPDVVAAGDVARWHHPLFGEEMRVEHWLNAAEQGRHAAGTILGSEEPFTHMPYFWSDQFDAKIQCIGVPSGADQAEVQRLDDSSLAIVYGRQGAVRGALCVNAPRDLARYRRAVADQVAWADVATP